MKYLLGLILIFVIASCGSDKAKPSKIEGKEKLIKRAERELDGQSEKIILLSAIKHVSYDSLYDILKNYYTDIGYETDKTAYESWLSLTAKKYGLPTKKLATLIFSFKYEMLSREDILNEAAEEAAYEEQEY